MPYDHPALVNSREMRIPNASALWALFSHSGAQIYSGGDSPQIWAWDVLGSALDAQIATALPGLFGAGLHPQHDLLAAGGADGSVGVWDLAAGAARLLARPHRQAVRAVRFGDGGATLISAGADGTVRATDAATGRRAANLKRVGSPIHGLAVAHDGSRVGVVCFKGTRVWDRAHADLFQRDGIYYHGGEGQSDLLFSADSRYLWVSFRTDPALRVWDLGVQPAALVGELALQAPAFTLALAHQHRYMAVGMFDAIALLDTSTYATLQRWKAPNGSAQLQGPIASLAFSPDDRWLCSTDLAGGVWIWSVAELIG